MIFVYANVHFCVSKIIPQNRTETKQNKAEERRSLLSLSGMAAVRRNMFVLKDVIARLASGGKGPIVESGAFWEGNPASYVETAKTFRTFALETCDQV